jgi:hypothetical protein
MSQDEPELPMVFQLGPTCCCNRTACSIGTFESILTVMKESMFPPHALDIDWSQSNFTEDKYKGVLPFPSYLTENLAGFPLLFSKKTHYYNERFLNLEPFIPLCLFNSKWLNNEPQHDTLGTCNLYCSSICTLFRPSNTFSEYNRLSQARLGWLL